MRVIIIVSFLALFATAAMASQDKVALVIGNGAYKNAGVLVNTINDANDLSKELSTLGFSVEKVINGDRKSMLEAVNRFGERLKKAKVGLFYFSGHGLQVKGRNYIVPINSKLQSESDVEFEMVDAGRVLGKMEDAGNGLNIVILDACRSNPFARSYRSAAQGLAQMDAPSGSFIAFATAPGTTASDGSGRNGTYTKHLLKNMKTPGLAVEQMFKQVRIGVMKESANKQVPWESSSLTGDFAFKQGKTSHKPAQPATNSATAKQEATKPQQKQAKDEWFEEDSIEAQSSANQRQSGSASELDMLTN